MMRPWPPPYSALRWQHAGRHPAGAAGVREQAASRGAERGERQGAVRPWGLVGHHAPRRDAPAAETGAVECRQTRSRGDREEAQRRHRAGHLQPRRRQAQALPLRRARTPVASALLGRVQASLLGDERRADRAPPGTPLRIEGPARDPGGGPARLHSLEGRSGPEAGHDPQRPVPGAASSQPGRPRGVAGPEPRQRRGTPDLSRGAARGVRSSHGGCLDPRRGGDPARTRTGARGGSTSSLEPGRDVARRWDCAGRTWTSSGGGSRSGARTPRGTR